ncbi:MAG: hypothetical protein AVDCRST_MAG65-823, partial [uncultured Solirubrobacteraceae bacterium]
ERGGNRGAHAASAARPAAAEVQAPQLRPRPSARADRRGGLARRRPPPAADPRASGRAGARRAVGAGAPGDDRLPSRRSRDGPRHLRRQGAAGRSRHAAGGALRLFALSCRRARRRGLRGRPFRRGAPRAGLRLELPDARRALRAGPDGLRGVEVDRHRRRRVPYPRRLARRAVREPDPAARLPPDRPPAAAALLSQCLHPHGAAGRGAPAGRGM